VVAENRKARHDYIIEDKYEAGIVLAGTEVKSLRMGKANLKDSYARIKNGEVFVYQMHIGAYPFAYFDNHDPLRPRKLLLHTTKLKSSMARSMKRVFAHSVEALFQGRQGQTQPGTGQGQAESRQA
jgi:SsrA-binding protein